MGQQGLKQFKHDVNAAAGVSYKGASLIRHGDSDGELVFTYAHEQLVTPLDIQVLAQNVESYPGNSRFMIFTSSQPTVTDLNLFLEKLSTHTQNKPVQGAIAAIADRLAAKLASTSAADDGDEYEEENEEAGGSEASVSIDEYDFELDEHYERDVSPLLLLSTTPHTTTAPFEPASARNLGKQLRAAQLAGIAVGILSSEERQLVSLSVPVAKLGIPKAALETWGLQASEYLVLLLKFPSGYPTLAEFIGFHSDQSVRQFRFGKCGKWKPSLASARVAFESKHEALDPQTETPDDQGRFEPIYMSNSINTLLNEKFVRWLAQRRCQNVSWDEAQATVIKLDGTATKPTGIMLDSTEADKEAESTQGTPATQGTAPFVWGHDYAMDGEKDFSIPLVSMQFAIQRLVRCTHYCLICHQKLHGDFETVKPYVCSNSLCLFQYHSLGFGPSIEHDVVHHPYVVDLLVSFFYATVTRGTTPDLPSGLCLRTVKTGSWDSPAEHLAVTVSFNKKEIKLNLDHLSSAQDMKKGDWFLLVVNNSSKGTLEVIIDSDIERHVCRILKIAGGYYYFDIIATENTVLDHDGKQATTNKQQATGLSHDEWHEAFLFQYKHDLDGFSPKERQVAIAWMMHSMPSVLDMRSYLRERPGRSLANWDRLNSSVLALLRWIVASNRSHIVQDDAVPIKDEKNEWLPSDSVNGVKGMEPGWMSFRLVQGSPDKENQFIKELGGRNCDEDGSPTLFAWHGSPLRNWHSIIRTGLHFDTTLNGRVFGQGVYFSNSFSVSAGYSSRNGELKSDSSSAVTSRPWPNSHLRVSEAISICEIINRPSKFVVAHPYYVVDKVEWIQCRYLFVRVEPTDLATVQRFPAPPPQDCEGRYVKQDSWRTLLGKSGIVEIPLSVLSSTRRYVSVVPSLSNQPAIETTFPTSYFATDQGAGHDENELGDDLGVLGYHTDSDDNSDGGSPWPNSAKRRRVASVTEFTPDPRSTSKFRSGDLDLLSLPRLPEPTWASSSPGASKRISRDIKDMERIQSETNIYTLGWYAEFENMHNMFHWILELHTFDGALPLAQDMEAMGHTSIVLELRFGSNYPMSPPFVRVVRPRFLPFARGGGGHVTAGGAICSELLTNSGWSPALSLEKVLLQVRVGLCELDPPARLESISSVHGTSDYGIVEAVDAYRRAAVAHGWQIPSDLDDNAV